MREHVAKSGKLIYFATRNELEALPGYRGNDRKGRACCPIHRGDNPTALSIDWATGWASCWSCGDAWSIRIGDPPQKGSAFSTIECQASRPTAYATPDPAPVERHFTAPRINLASAIEIASGNLTGSPGETYLAGRGIPLATAQALRLGWAASGILAGRVIFPLCNPDGLVTSATGRAINDHTQPKYKALKSGDGYVKTLFNGGAIAQAKQSGHPVVVVEGPLDAAACVAAGLPLTVALCGKSYKRPEHFAGLTTVILALDADEAGQEGRRQLWLDLMARGIEVLVLPAAALDGTKDLCEYWQRFRRMPRQLAARATGPHMQAIGYPMEANTPHEGLGVYEHETFPKVAVGELRRQVAVHGPAMPPRPGELSADLKAEAEALAGDLRCDELLAFWTDLRQREQQLTREDYIAGTYAVWLALAAYADDQFIDAA